MKLSIVERTLLYNQLEILKALKPDQARSYDEQQKILDYGYEGRYDDVMPVMSDSTLSPEECRFVERAVDMYWIMQKHASYIDFDDKRLVFPGFDGNNETELMGYARFLRDEEGRFDGLECSIGDMNAIMPMSRQYRDMLPVYMEALHELDAARERLSAEQIRRVLDAGSPPR